MLAGNDTFHLPGLGAFKVDRLLAMWVGAGAITLILGGVPLDSHAQMVLAYAAMILIGFLRHRNLSPGARILLLYLGVFVSIRYIIWRTCYTIHYHDLPSYIFAILLYIAELYGIVVYFLGVFVNIEPMGRQPVPMPQVLEEWPTVDIFVPTYNESPEIIETTLHAAVQIRYPRTKLKVWLLDDGGTVQKRTDKNPEKAHEALNRHIMLQGICEALGVGYLTRERNLHAKAGNLNSALERTDGDLVLILDTDHVPTVDFLEKTVGWFVKDPKMFLVQTPHFFLNADPLERNLGTFGKMPGEAEMFYNITQHGLDFWNAAFFCGSAAVLRRKCLNEVGGICGESITEDCETALSLHSKGYHSAYIGQPLVAGLAPETFTGFTVQRMRWAQGMIQIFILKNPITYPGLTLPQRICYFSNCFFWFFAYSRIMFLLAPAFFLVAGLKVYDSTWIQFLAYGLPHTVCSIWISNYLYGAARWTFISELYELMQCVYTLPAMVRVFLNPRTPTFQVTPKGEQLDESFISPLVTPFYFFIGLTAFCIAMALRQVFCSELDSPAVFVTLFWSSVNLLLLITALGALYEQRQRRSTSRVELEQPITLDCHGSRAEGTMVNLSIGGAGLTFGALPRNAAQWLGQSVTVEIPPAEGEKTPLRFHGEIRNMRDQAGKTFVGFQFLPRNKEEVQQKVNFLYGRSGAWTDFQAKRERRIGTIRSLIFLAQIGLRQGGIHLHLVFSLLCRRVWRMIQRGFFLFREAVRA